MWGKVRGPDLPASSALPRDHKLAGELRGNAVWGPLLYTDCLLLGVTQLNSPLKSCY